jgi:rubrerythrin
MGNLMITRRQALVVAFISMTSCLLGVGRRTSQAETSYPQTIETLEEARDRQMAVYHQYVEFGRKAKAEGYRGVAYLFTSLAAAELIHAQNFAKILARLGVEIVPVGKPQASLGSTRDNLIRAADDEIDSIDSFYPKTLARLKPEGLHDAIAFTTYAWESEKQHRDLIKRIQRWSPSFFERVARTIDENSDQYFVCQLCGSTLNEIPPGTCPICGMPSDHYRKIEIPT